MMAINWSISFEFLLIKSIIIVAHSFYSKVFVSISKNWFKMIDQLTCVLEWLPVL